jgi:hypothetical protein
MHWFFVFLLLSLPLPTQAEDTPPCPATPPAKTHWGKADWLNYAVDSRLPELQTSGQYRYRFNDQGDVFLVRDEGKKGEILVLGDEIVFLNNTTPEQVQMEYLITVPQMLVQALEKAFKTPADVTSRQKIEVAVEDSATRRFNGWAAPDGNCGIAFSITYSAAKKGDRPQRLQTFRGVWAMTGQTNPIDGKVEWQKMQRVFARALVDSPNKQKYLEMSSKIPAYVDLEEARSHAKLIRGFGLDGLPPAPIPLQKK